MGWKTSLIIINSPPKIDNKQLLASLGLKGLSKKADTVLEDLISSSTNKVCIGQYNNNLIIYIWGVPEKIIQKNNTDFEKKLTQQFPNNEICVVCLVSTVGYWGYKIINNGQIIRNRAGDADNGTYIDIGEPLEEEKDLFSKSTVDSKGVRTYKFEHDPDYVYNEDQVGENFVFNICSRYLKYPLDEADAFLKETQFHCFKKSWWKLW